MEQLTTSFGLRLEDRWSESDVRIGRVSSGFLLCIVQRHICNARHLPLCIEINAVEDFPLWKTIHDRMQGTGVLYLLEELLILVRLLNLPKFCGCVRCANYLVAALSTKFASVSADQNNKAISRQIGHGSVFFGSDGSPLVRGKVNITKSSSSARPFPTEL